MNTTTIVVRELQDSKYQVFDGELLLACFANKTAAYLFAEIAKMARVSSEESTPLVATQSAA